MKYVLSIFLALTCVMAHSQIPGKKTNAPTTIFDGALTVHVGDTLNLGSGADPATGNFVHIYAMGWTMNTTYGIGDDQNRLDRSYANQYLIVEVFREKNHKHTGYRKYTQIKIGTWDDRYNADLEAAIRAGEIVAINGTDVTGYQDKPQEATSTPNTGLSLAEELQKLAELHAAGVLTDEEFAQAKAALISKQ